ncbi:dipeptidase [Microbulbifer agarilyticus]|uniref:dipeptidase n=1 Tax=Microbulbifer agarilyticus TaxID=260552 RepID=UPI001C948114|nr:membrane dipeptidase [Microbulbifer agarilyticus]MBY6211738.1 dipeptidase [Microbulbifer agarilyticus]
MNRRAFNKNMGLMLGAAALGGFQWSCGKKVERQISVFDGAGFPHPPEPEFRVQLTDRVISDLHSAGYRMLQSTVGTVGAGEDLFKRSMADIERIHGEVAAFPDTVQIVQSAADLETVYQSEKVGLIMGFQDTRQLEKRVENIDRFYEVGVRCIQLTYNLDNHAGSGCLSDVDGGLKPFGYEVIERMRDRGILLDLSHASRKTTRESLQNADYPVAITHSGCDAVFSHPRNNPDDTLKMLADRGGVIGIYFMPFLCAKGTARSEDLIAHIEHAINVCGEEGVGIGTDNATHTAPYSEEDLRMWNEELKKRKEAGISAPREEADSFLYIEDLYTPRRFYDLADLLSRRGHSESRIEKILGSNFRRLFSEVI